VPATRQTLRRVGLAMRGADLGWFVTADATRHRIRLVEVENPEQPGERMWVKLIDPTPPRPKPPGR
jgi:hypothetical protein